MKITLSTGEEFIPKWQGNDKSESPIIFKLHYLTMPERESCQYFVAPIDDKKRSEKSIRVRVDLSRFFMLGVESIKGLTVEVDGVEKAILTAEDFMALPGMDDLYTEVALRVKETSGIQVKN